MQEKEQLNEIKRPKEKHMHAHSQLKFSFHYQFERNEYTTVFFLRFFWGSKTNLYRILEKKKECVHMQFST